MSKTVYSICPRDFPDSFEWNEILGRGENQYVIDLPADEWHKTAVVNSLHQRLEAGDMIRMPNGSWLEITAIAVCYGTNRSLYAMLERKGTLSDQIGVVADGWKDKRTFEQDIFEKRKAGKVYQTEATTIR